MAVYANVYWFYPDNGVLDSIEHIKLSDTISYQRLRNTYQNYRFDDYYIITDMENIIIDYINNSPNHKWLDARVVEDFLPMIFIKSEE